MAPCLRAPVMPASAGVAQRCLSASSHALRSFRYLLEGQPADKSVVPFVLPYATHTQNNIRLGSFSPKDLWSTCSTVDMNSSPRKPLETGGRGQRNATRGNRSSGGSSPTLPCVDEVCPLLNEPAKNRECRCWCGKNCLHFGSPRFCQASTVALFPFRPVETHQFPAVSTPAFSRPPSSAVVIDGSISASPLLLHRQRQENRFFSNLPGDLAAAATVKHQLQATAPPTPPPIFGCTGWSSSYEAVAEAVGDDDGAAEAALAPAKLTSRRGVLRITSMDLYETCVYEKSQIQPLICCFVTRGSLRSKLLLQPFKELAIATAAATRPESTDNTHGTTSPLFLLIDCDEVPRAAYHARVEHVPSIVVMKKDDGFRDIITDPAATKTAAEFIQETRQALERLQQREQQLPGGVQAGPSRYTKNIGIDNLNVYRVGWVAQ